MSGLRILIIDDDRDVAESLAEYLELDGHRVDVQHSARSGLAAATEQDYDQVIVDVGLPDADGVQIARSIQDAKAGTSVLLISGLSGSNLTLENKGSVRLTVLSKPLDLEELSRRLDQVRRSRDGSG